MRTISNTTSAFVSINGTVCKYSELYKGVEAEIRNAVSKGWLNRWEAEDIQQDAAYKATVYSGHYDERLSNARTYGAIIARSCVLSYVRRKRYSTVSLSDLLEREADDSYYEQTVFGCYRGNEYDADRAILAAEQYAALGAGLDKLTPLDCSIAVLAAHGYKPAEIAKETGCTPNAVSTRLCRLRRVLKSEYCSVMAA